MDFATFLGLLIALGSMVAAVFVATGDLHTLMALLEHPNAFIMVFGGTLGVLFISYPLSDMMQLPKVLVGVFRVPNLKMPQTVDFLVDAADQVRKHGLLSMESRISEAPSPFLQRALQLLVDGYNSQELESTLKAELQLETEAFKHKAHLYEAAGGYAPTIGIVGTVLELIHVLGNLSTPDVLGHAIAGAFLATFYGIFTANFFWLPIGKKYQGQAEARHRAGEMIILGILMVQAGDSGRKLRDRLEAFLHQKPAPKKGGG